MRGFHLGSASESGAHAVARTNVQLYEQLRAAGYDESDLGRVFDAYTIAMQLHSARFRPSGRTFLSHLVGTASILAFLESPLDVVIAGLLHGAYDQGDFGDGSRGIRPDKREQLRRAVGEEIEERVASYCRLAWNFERLTALRDVFDGLGPLERDTLLVRLANELEDHLDRSILYCANAETRRAELEKRAEGMSDLARRLGHEDLARAFATCVAECGDDGVPARLRHPIGASFNVVPPSLGRRPALVLADNWQRLRERLGRAAARIAGRGR